MTAGKWYTVLIESAAFLYKEQSTHGDANLFSGIHNTACDFYIRGFKFTHIAVNDGYIYQQGNTLMQLPDFGEINPSYSVTVNGEPVTLTDGNKFRLTEAGDYIAQINSHTIYFTVYSEDDFNAMIAPLTSKQYNNFSVSDSAVTSFAFDNDMKAYRYTTSNTNGSDYDGKTIVTLNKLSVPYLKLKNNYGNYEYVAFDIYLISDIANLAFWINGAQDLNPAAGLAGGAALIFEADDLSRTPVAYADMVKERWYTIYLTSGNWSNDVSIITLYEANAVFDAYMRNFRFASTMLQDKFSYEVTDLLKELPDLGQENPEYSVTLNGDTPVEVFGNKLRLSLPGVYTAQIGSESITFTVYSADDYKAIVAPLDSTQYDSAFYTSDPSITTFEYDDTMGAYHYVINTGSNYTPTRLLIVENSVPYKKFEAEYANYDYFAFDIYYTSTVTDVLFWIQNPVQYVASAYMIYEAGDPETTVAYNEMTAGKWYTVLIHSDAFLYKEGSTHGDANLFSGIQNTECDFYIKALRFVS